VGKLEAFSEWVGLAYEAATEWVPFQLKLSHFGKRKYFALFKIIYNSFFHIMLMISLIYIYFDTPCVPYLIFRD
jgi:hypothetical protein